MEDHQPVSAKPEAKTYVQDVETDTDDDQDIKDASYQIPNANASQLELFKTHVVAKRQMPRYVPNPMKPMAGRRFPGHRGLRQLPYCDPKFMPRQDKLAQFRRREDGKNAPRRRVQL